MSARLSHALSIGALSLPQTGGVLVLRSIADGMAPELPRDRCHVVQGFLPQAQALERAGFAVSPEVPEGAFSAAVVCVHKSKPETLRLLAEAVSHVPQGAPVIVDGAKADGIESILKTCRKVFEVGAIISKAHGKVFEFTSAPAPQTWRAEAVKVQGYETGVGTFSAGAVDKGSALMVTHLPRLSGQVCDLGAGWGFLSGEVIKRGDPIVQIDLVEAEWAAAEAARRNLAETPNARVVWADARAHKGRYDWVISNPPFHTGRQADPALGQAFIRQAAQICAPRGRFVMVANRHLPYEATLAEVFAETVVLADTGGYKVVQASRPRKR